MKDSTAARSVSRRRARTARETRRASVAAPGPRLRAANTTADRAIDTLLLFSDEKPNWSAAEIAARFDMPRSTVYRYLNSLRSYALIVEDADGGFQLGPRIFPLARIAKASTSILTVAAPHLGALNRQFGEAVTLYERVGHEAIALTRLESLHRVRINYIRGQLLPWPAAASSKVLLAHASRDEQRGLFRLMVPERYTEKTIRSISALRSVLGRIRREGYAYSDQERDHGIRGIAAPIFSQEEGRYCVTMSGPSFRLTDKKRPEMISSVVRTAAKISEALLQTDY